MANSVTARFNDDCKVHVAMSDDTTVTKAVIIDAEGNETDIGGGESDFSTAKLTLTRGESNDGKFYVPVLMTSPGGTSLFPILNDVAGTDDYDIIVYTGGTVLMYTGTYTLTLDGDIQAVGVGTYRITGDCSITLNDPE